MDFDEIADNNEEEQSDLNELLLFDEDKDSQFKSLKDVVVFLVDCNQNMVKEAIPKIIHVIESFLKTKIITNEKDLFSLILYNTQSEKNILQFKGINNLISISEPDARLIKEIKILVSKTDPNLNPNYISFIQEKFNPVKDMEVSLNDALWICQTEFKIYDAKKYNRRIFLFTDNDDPMLNNMTERKRTIQRGKDMLDSEIVLELFPMNVNRPFDMRKFYSDIITIDNLSEDLVLSRGSFESRLRELSKRIRQKEIKKRTLGRCPFFLSKDIKFNINFYAGLHKATKPKSYLVDGKTNKNLNVVNHAICKETGSVLYQNQIGTYQEYGGSKVIFSKDDMKKIKTMDDPGLKLMGFKDASFIKPYHNIRESYFLYPNEFLSNGASQLCDALIKQLTVKNKVAIVKFVPRDGASIRFCALLPQKESFDEDYFQTPPGFNLIFLPYSDDIRSNSDILQRSNIEGTINENNLISSKAIIKKMNIDFDTRSFENPVLQRFFSTLQALALGENETEYVEDLINPDSEGLKGVLKGLDEEFRESIYDKGAGLPIPISTIRAKKSSEKIDNDIELDENDQLNGSEIDSGLKRKRFFEETPKKMKIDKKNIVGVVVLDEDSDEIGASELKKSNKKTPDKSKENNKFSDNYLYKLRDEGKGLATLSINNLKSILVERNISHLSREKKEDLMNKVISYLENK